MTTSVRTPIAIALTLIASANIYARGLTPTLLVAAKMDGSQETPSVSTPAQGVASLTISPDRKTIALNVSMEGLSGYITAADISEGTVGASGLVILDLKPQGPRDRITMNITGADLAKLSLAKLISGSYYINVHTALYPNGEIRGQLRLETDYGYRATLLPIASTIAVGFGTFDLSQNDSALKINVVVSIQGGSITGVHLHRGALGVDGPAVLNLSDSVKGNWISATINPRAILSDLKAGHIYINVQTAAHPNGELRGQLTLDSTAINFDAILTGAQMIPPVNTQHVAIVAVSFIPPDKLKRSVQESM